MADFGTDVSTVPDLDPSFSSISGNRVLAEMAIRRVTTTRGTVADDPDFGINIRDYLNSEDPGFFAGATSGTLGAIKADVEKELVKDQRIQSANALVEYYQNKTGPYPANSLHLTITLNAATGPFTLELAITSVTLAILKTG